MTRSISAYAEATGPGTGSTGVGVGVGVIVGVGVKVVPTEVAGVLVGSVTVGEADAGSVTVKVVVLFAEAELVGKLVPDGGAETEIGTRVVFWYGGMMPPDGEGRIPDDGPVPTAPVPTAPVPTRPVPVPRGAGTVEFGRGKGAVPVDSQTKELLVKVAPDGAAAPVPLTGMLALGNGYTGETTGPPGLIDEVRPLLARLPLPIALEMVLVMTLVVGSGRKTVTVVVMTSSMIVGLLMFTSPSTRISLYPDDSGNGDAETKAARRQDSPAS